jgi:branched-chain amino acid transport system permease protein
VAGGRWLEGRLAFHFTCLALLALTWALVHLLLESRFGRVLRAARENETRARAVGFEPYRYRLLAYVIAGAIGGLAGVLLSQSAEFVAPAYLTWQRSGDLLFMVILGGLAGPHGALLGALAFVLLEEWLSHLTEHWRLIFGPLLILCVFWMPRGIAGLLRRG